MNFQMRVGKTIANDGFSRVHPKILYISHKLNGTHSGPRVQLNDPIYYYEH